MHKILEWVKAHPYETGALVLVVGLAGFFLLDSSSGSSSASTAAGSTDSAAADYYQAQLQSEQLEASEGAAQAQVDSQNQQADLQAQVQNNEVTAQLQATQDQDSAAVQAAQIQAGVTNNQTTAAVQAAKISAGVQNTATNAQVTENNDNLQTILGITSAENDTTQDYINSQTEDTALNDQSEVDVSGQQYGYLTNTANDQTNIALTGLQDSTQLESQQQADVQQDANQILPQLGTGSNQYTAQLSSLLEGLEGDSAGAGDEAGIAVAQTNAAALTSTANTKAITSGVSSIATGLFA